MGTSKPISIAVIGAGPSGLFFCHAIEYMMKQTGKEVSVTCFEKSSQPGGIWRSAESKASSSDAETTQMYDKLWTNGSSHLTEFFDYTYDEHFGRPVSVYMKRQDLLGYILGRVHKNCPDFLEKYVKFQTLVDNVVYNDADQQFDISIKHLDDTQKVEVQHFDKCIWACGENGRRNIPENIVRIFRDGGFKGRIIHSADTARLEDDVKDKRILLIGGGLSAEDLALQAIKLKAKKIYVSTRVKAEICWTSHWPKNKVKVLLNQAPISVTENGNCIQFMEVEWQPDGYVRDGDYIETEIRNIDTVILCTGYRANIDMLDPNLRQGFPKGKLCHDEYVPVPKDWKMSPNMLTKFIGDVPVSDKVHYYSCYIHPKLHRGVLISNPNMMFISTYGAHVPLMACDVFAWLHAGYITGLIDMPTPDEMRALNVKEGLQYLDIPYFRYLMDDTYLQAVNSIENLFPDDPAKSTPLWDEVEYDEYHQSIKVLARTMQEAKYPFSLGTYEKINENGETTMEFGYLSYYHRAYLAPVGNEKNWKTFRDYDDAEKFYSLFTGTKAVKIEKPWMEIDGTSDGGLKVNNEVNGRNLDIIGDFKGRVKIGNELSPRIPASL
jgi:thioredoxin reductase